MKLRSLFVALLFTIVPCLAHAAAVAPLETLAKQAIVVDATTGDVLFEKEADAKMPTSSMSKIMTMYLVFEAIKDQKIALDNSVIISHAARMQDGSRMFVNEGQEVKIEDLVRGVIVQSGNDAAVALAEAVAGSETSFAELMNTKAATLGMTNSHFVNATGLPDPNHYSTARDLALLAQTLIKNFPDYYHYYSETEFTYNNIKQGNRNPLLYRNMNVDGMKTGHTEDAGYGLIASAMRDGRRVITVANGLKTMQERADESAKMVEWAYREYGVFTFVNAEQVAGEAKVWLGKAQTVKVAPAKSVTLCLPRTEKDNVKVNLTVNNETTAPIARGQIIGKLTVTMPDKPSIEIDLVTVEEVAKLGFFEALFAKAKRALGKE